MNTKAKRIVVSVSTLTDGMTFEDARIVAAEFAQMTSKIAELEAQLDAVGAGGVSALVPKRNSAPSSRGIYAWTPDSGGPALVLVDKRPSEHSPGGVLNGHVIKTCSFYDGCPVETWGCGRWVLLRSTEPAGHQSGKS